MTTAVVSPVPAYDPTDAEIQERFLALMPELNSRMQAIGKNVCRKDAEEFAAEALAMCWRNFRAKARRGTWLNATQLAWYSWAWVQSGRRIAGGSATDVHDEQCQRRGRSKIISISTLMQPRRKMRCDVTPMPDRLQKDFERAVSGRHKESPLQRAATRIDWRALSEKLSPRLRTLLKRLSRGDRPGEIAVSFGVSPGRISQMITALKEEVVKFFGGDLAVPS
jgi:DNA-binding CsgD family transcriptional regulator